MVYFDTSALVKRYVSEAGSDAVESFVDERDAECVISPLVTTEFESVLQRLLRAQAIDTRYANQARRDLNADLASAVWTVRPFAIASFDRARGLLGNARVPLATLDALHLACGLEMACTDFATGDRQLARAATAAGLVVHSF